MNTAVPDTEANWSRTVDTPHGPARASGYLPPDPLDVRATLVLGHGAGKGTDTSDLQLLARTLPEYRITVVLVDQPWVLAGRRVAAPARQLDAAWTEVLTALRDDDVLTGALVVGGRSTGARVACRTAVAVAADALLLLAFPLLPPSSRKDPVRADSARATRLAELAATGPRPVVIAQGERDAFGTADVLADVLADQLPANDVVAVVEVPGADHALRVRGPDDAVATALVTAAVRAVDLAA